MNWKTVIAAVVAIALLAILISFRDVTVWVGRFPLTILVRQDETSNVDTATFRFATCWNDIEAKAAMESGGSNEMRFLTADEVSDDRFTISVPCSGREGPFGIEYSYVQPKYVVVEMYNDDGSTVRKQLEIPTGRGARVVLMTLP